MKKIIATIMTVFLLLSALAACAPEKAPDDPAKANEEKYLEAFDLLEQKNYEAAYALFLALGDYKDAAKEASKFHYAPVEYALQRIDEAEGTTTERITFSYNESNLISQYVLSSESSGSITGICTYNASGKLTEISYLTEDPTPKKYECTYSPNGEIIKETTTLESGYVFSYEYTYDESGAQTKIIFEDANGTLSYDCLYHADGRISKIVLKGEDGNELKSEEYVYDENGRRVRINFSENGGIIGFCEYTYNEKGDMIREHYDYGELFSFTSNYTFDAHGNMIKDHTTFSDHTETIREISHKLVYVPFEYSEEDWKYFIRTVSNS